MPSDLEQAMELLITVFHRYASRDGRSGTLSRRELRELMENELSNFLKVSNPAERSQVTCNMVINASSGYRSLRRTLLLLIQS